MTCRECNHFEPSMKASAPRPGLIGFGYCKAAPDAVLRARFFHDSQANCWVRPQKFTRRTGQ